MHLSKNSKLKFYINTFFTFLLLLLLIRNSYAQRTLAPISKFDSKKTEGDLSASLKMSGNATLVTNYLEHAVSQTNNDPALQGSYLFNLGSQLKLGLWGSNVYYPNEMNHFNLRLVADIKVNFDQDFDAFFSFSNNHFYKSNSRNGNTLNLFVQAYEYLVGLSQESNWEGTRSTSNHFLFGYLWQLNPKVIWQNNIEYNQISTSGYKSYFDFNSSLIASVNPMILKMGLTYNSSANQFDGRGKTYLIFSISTDF